LLILTNIAVFVYQLYATYHQGASLAETYGAVPRRITHDDSLLPPLPNPFHKTLITSLFLHDVRIVQGGFIHLIGNMLYLSAFGPNLEHLIGRFRFLLFYLLCGVIAALAHVVIHHDSGYPLIGASGAIAGVMGAHFMACPQSRIRCLVLIYPVLWPAGIVILPWILIQIINAYFSYTPAPIAWLAHIAGFAAGMFFIGKFQQPWLRTKREVYKIRPYF
jgi:membrane associated rhomboid family serine protease